MVPVDHGTQQVAENDLLRAKCRGKTKHNGKVRVILLTMGKIIKNADGKAWKPKFPGNVSFP